MLYRMGTDAWRNWRGFDGGNAESENVDEVLYSDRHFVGGPTDLGPYALTPILGLLPPTEVPLMRPAVLMRVGMHENLIPDIVIDGELVPANSDNYHGGNASDEIAALTSLELGVRLRVAGTSRMSLRHEEGSEDRPPIHVEVVPLTQPGRPGREYIPAVLTRPAHLNNLDRLATFPTLDERAQVELVRASSCDAQARWSRSCDDTI